MNNKTESAYKATARPWQCNGEIFFHQRNPGGRKTYVGIISFDVPAETAKANAALIVTAVNEYAALKAVAEAAMLFDGEETVPGPDAYERLSEALSNLSAIRNQKA